MGPRALQSHPRVLHDTGLAVGGPNPPPPPPPRRAGATLRFTFSVRPAEPNATQCWWGAVNTSLGAPETASSAPPPPPLEPTCRFAALLLDASEFDQRALPALASLRFAAYCAPNASHVQMVVPLNGSLRDGNGAGDALHLLLTVPPGLHVPPAPAAFSVQFSVAYTFPGRACVFALPSLGVVLALPLLCVLGVWLCVTPRHKRRGALFASCFADPALYPVVRVAPLAWLRRCVDVRVPFLAVQNVRFRNYFLSFHPVLWAFFPRRGETLTHSQCVLLLCTFLAFELLVQSALSGWADAPALRASLDTLPPPTPGRLLRELTWKVVVGSLVADVVSASYAPVMRFALSRDRDPLRAVCAPHSALSLGACARGLLRFVLVASFLAVAALLLGSFVWVFMAHYTCEAIWRSILLPFLVSLFARSIFPGVLLSYATYRLKATFGTTAPEECDRVAAPPPPLPTAPTEAQPLLLQPNSV